jgi:RHS repeat-associated protein
VEANDGFDHVTQSVDYVYEPLSFDGQTFLYLTHANYSGGDTASYEYQRSNRLPEPFPTPPFEGNVAGVIKKCTDDRFGGPMKSIIYELRPRDSYFGSAYGEIWKERNEFNQPLSELIIPLGGTHSRKEHRPDGSEREFVYGNDVFLTDRTDFMGHSVHLTSTFVNNSTSIVHFENEKGYTTDRLVEGDYRAATRVTYPATSTEPGRSYVEIIPQDGPTHPHYTRLYRDERGKETEYIRDPNNHRVMRINHPPGGGFETFTYNEFGQVLDHQMTNGGIEHFTYDRGLKQTYTPPATDSDPPGGPVSTQYFYYGIGPTGPIGEPGEPDNVGAERPDLNDRLKRIIDPRGNSTWFLYNPRGQVTQTIHTGGATTKSGYKSDGTLLWTQDELLHTTNYACDEYKRVTEVKKLVDGVEEKVTNDYTPRNGLDSYSHTTSSVYSVESRSGESLYTKIDHDYDPNFRLSWTTAAPGAPRTNFHYDPAGNLDSIEDPRHKFTHFGYDERNRKTSTLNDELNQSVEVEYDPGSNKTKETRHEENGVDAFRSWDYDDMNRLSHAYDWRTNPTPAPNQTTTYEPDNAGNVISITDTKGAVYGFEYDKLNRKTKAKYPTAYPSPTPTETWHYDAAGNVNIYTNPATQVRNFHYDNRNRQDHSWWTGGVAVGPDIVTGYDNASRVTSIVTKNGTTPITTVAFGYDEANRKLWEEQTLFRPNGTFMSHRVKSPLDHDGRRTNLQITDPPQEGGNLSVSAEMPGSGSYSISYNYNDRNQLWHINGDYGENWHFTYLYDDSGNMTSRQADYNGNINITGCANGPDNDYDALNRPRTWEQVGPNGFHTLSHHYYDKANRENATWRDEDQNGERFAYEPTNQLAGVAYKAPNVSAWPPPNGAQRIVTYGYTPDKLSRSTMTDNGNPTNYTPNALSQYTIVGNTSYLYDTNFNLKHTGTLVGVYDAANHLVSANSAAFSASFVYDGLGRCVKRTLGNEATVFVFDGWKPIGEFDEWNNFQAWNVYGPGADEILLRDKGKGIGYTIFLLDRHGNVAFLLDNDGLLREKYSYDVFGRPTIANMATGETIDAPSWYSHDFLFQGREYIAPLGIYDYRNRFYLPATGRFLQSDPKGFAAGDMNLFRYCGDDPVDLSDPLGLYGEEIPDLEQAMHVARSRVLDVVRSPNRPVVSLRLADGPGAGRTVRYTPGISVSVLKAKSGNYELSDTLHGTPQMINRKWYDVEPVVKGAVAPVHSHHDTGNGIGRGGWSDLDLKLKMVERMDESKQGVWHRRTRMNDGSYKKDTYRDNGSKQGGGDSSGGGGGGQREGHSSGPTARDIDNAHQATGVPSLGAEAVNFAPGRP